MKREIIQSIVKHITEIKPQPRNHSLYCRLKLDWAYIQSFDCHESYDEGKLKYLLAEDIYNRIFTTIGGEKLRKNLIVCMRDLQCIQGRLHNDPDLFEVADRVFGELGEILKDI